MLCACFRIESLSQRIPGLDSESGSRYIHLGHVPRHRHVQTHLIINVLCGLPETLLIHVASGRKA